MGQLSMALRVPITNNELTAKMAQDSTSMVTTALYNPPIPVIPRAAQVFLVHGESDDDREGEENVE